MSIQSARRQLTAMERAVQCSVLGARTRTIAALTGMSQSEIVRLLGDDRPVARGRCPDSVEWYHRANVLERTEASFVVVRCVTAMKLHFDPVESLLHAYELYKRRFDERQRISFDRAFELTARSCGLWKGFERKLSIATCRSCHGDYLTVLTNLPGSPADCPFCSLIRRYYLDPRLQQEFPERSCCDQLDVIEQIATLAPMPDARDTP